MLTNMWFIGTVWLYFYRLFISDQQVGLLDGMAFAIGLVAEVPSGALADRIGRDKAVRIGLIVAGSGLLVQAAGSSFLPFFVGQSVLMIGLALVSGADEALFYEKLAFPSKTTHWRKLVTRGSQAALIGSLVGYVVGGGLHTFNPRLPWIFTAVAFVAAAFLILSVDDVRATKPRRSVLIESRNYVNDIRIGFAQFRTPRLRLYVPLIIVLQGLLYTFGYGLLKLVLLDRFGFDPFWGSVVVGTSSVITVGILAYMHRRADRLSESRVFATVGIMAALSLLLSLADIGLWGYFVIVALYAGEHVMAPFISEVLNSRVSETQRATVLSVASFLKTLPYVLLAPLIGMLSTNGDLEYFLVGWAAAISVAVPLQIFARRSSASVALPD